MAQESGMPMESSSELPVRPRVLVFFDYTCPFCYLDWPRLKRLRADHGVELFPVPFELRPMLSLDGVAIGDVGGGHSERVEEHMRRMAREGGLSIAFPAFMPNTHRALALGEYARDAGAEVHEAVHEAVFAAYNGHGADIGRTDVLLTVAGENGLDTADVEVALEEGRFDERLHQFHHLALALGITATPAALICNQILIGSRPYEVLSQALEGCLIDERNIEAAPASPGAADSATIAREGEPPSITA